MKRIFLLLFLLCFSCVASRGSSCIPYAPTPDERLSLCSLSINGCVLSVRELGPAYNGGISHYEAEVKVLTIHHTLNRKHPPGTIRVIFQVSNGYDGKPIVTADQPIPKAGDRYTLFLLPADEAQELYTLSNPTDTPAGMNLLPLHDGQPDDAPILLGDAVATLAKTELRKHRPELRDVHIKTGFWNLHWTVTLSNIKTPELPEAQIVIDTAGRIGNTTWIAAEPVRKVTKIPEKEIGIPLALQLHSQIAQRRSSPSAGDRSNWSFPVPATWGRVTSADASGLRGDFYGSTVLPSYDNRISADDLFGIQRLAVVPVISPPRPVPRGMIGWSHILTLDHVAYQASLILNGRVMALSPLDAPLPEAYRQRELKGEPQWLEVEVLATLKGKAPKTVRLPYVGQKEPSVEKGRRYTFLLQQEGEQLIMANPYSHYAIFPLSEDQKNDAPLLLESGITRIAQAEYARHHPEPDYIEIHPHRGGDGWHVTFPTYHSQFGTPMDCAAELFFTKDGKITNGWVAAEPPRGEARKNDIGKCLRFTLREHSAGAPPSYRRSFFGVLKSVDNDALSGTFFSLSGKIQLRRIAKQDLTGVQQLALTPSPPR